MMNRIVMLLLVAALFAACDAGSEQQEFPQGDSLPLNFLTTVVDPRTRAELTTNNLTSTGIFAYLTDGDFNQSTATPNFMLNQKLERANNASPWTYSPIKYWPNNTTDKLSFFAYAPYVDETVTGGSNPSFQEKTTAKGFPTLSYTVPSTEANQIDLLASVPLMNQTYKGVSGSIGLAMEHALSRVKFSIKSEMKLNVTKDGLSVTATQSNEWTSDSSGDEALNSKELAPGYKATDLKFGDFYYSDGTTSDGGYRKYADNTTAVLNIMPMLTDKDGNARSVVAIVFYAGKHPTDTGDYSTTGIGTSTFHGYAVALRDVGRMAWCNNSGYNTAVGTSTSYDDWQGFYNQQQIEAYVAANSADGWTMNNFPAANGCKNFNPIAPATSSGWFHPSSGQLKGLSGGNYNTLNSSFFSRAKGSNFSNYYYWSSSEDNDYSKAHHVPLIYGYNGGDTKTESKFPVRPILAF